jgi:hypothetical protein
MFPNRNANRQTLERLSMKNEDRKVGGQACQAECRLINKLKLHAIIFAASRTAKVDGRKDLIL